MSQLKLLRGTACKMTGCISCHTSFELRVAKIRQKSQKCWPHRRLHLRLGIASQLEMGRSRKPISLYRDIAVICIPGWPKAEYVKEIVGTSTNPGQVADSIRQEQTSCPSDNSTWHQHPQAKMPDVTELQTVKSS